MPRRADTLEVAKEIADRVAAVVPSTKPLSDLEQVKVPEPLKIEAMRMDGLLESVKKVNEYLPGMVDTLLVAFHMGTKIERENEDGEIEEEWVPPTITERLRIFDKLARFALTDKRLETEFGLLRDMAGQNGGINLNQLNILQLRQLPKGAVDDELKRLAEER